MSPADSASRAGAMPKAGGDRSSRTFGREIPASMKALLILFLLLLSGSHLPAFAIWSIELTPENCVDKGFSFKVTSSKQNKNLLGITVVFYKVPTKIQEHSGAILELITDQDDVIARCNIQSFEERMVKTRDKMPLREPDKDFTPPLLIYSFTISETLLKKSRFCINEEALANNNEKYWFQIGLFLKQ